MPPPIVLAENLVKWYGPRPAIRDVSFSVAPGEVVGLLGPNGSGKSTIFRILTGYLAPSSGTARVADYDVATQSLALRREIGYVPEDAPLYDHMRVAEFLRFMARIKGLEGSRAARAVEEASDRLELREVMATLIGKLSRGFRQRVALAQAILNEPKLLVLDEPTSGLDPAQVIALRGLVRSLAGRQTILIASHVLSEIERIASRVMILLDGELLTADALGDGARSRSVRLVIAGAAAEIVACLGAVAGVRSVSVAAAPHSGPGEYLVVADPRPTLTRDLAGTCVQHGLDLSELVEVRPDLEQIFLEMTRRRREAAA